MLEAIWFRRSLSAAVLAMLAFFLATCGGAGSKSPKIELNAADQAWAKKISLHLSDFPAGWQWAKKTQKITRPGCGPSFGGLTLTGRARSREIDTPSRFHGKFGIGSNVTIFRTEGQAIAAYDLFISKQSYDCIAEQITRNYEEHGLHLGPATVPSGVDDFPKMGDRSQNYVFYFSIHRGEHTDTGQGVIYGLLFVQRGRAVVGLSTVVYRPGYVPWEGGNGFEDIARKVAGRMKIEAPTTGG